MPRPSIIIQETDGRLTLFCSPSKFRARPLNARGFTMEAAGGGRRDHSGLARSAAQNRPPRFIEGMEENESRRDRANGSHSATPTAPGTDGKLWWICVEMSPAQPER